MFLQIPELPQSNQVSYLTKRYWNQGVTATFVYLSNLPETACSYVKKGINQAQQNPEIKKFYESLSAPSQEPKVEKK